MLADSQPKYSPDAQEQTVLYKQADLFVKMLFYKIFPKLKVDSSTHFVMVWLLCCYKNNENCKPVVLLHNNIVTSESFMLHQGGL